MARDLALLRRAAVTGRAVLRLYAWERPTVSFGRHEAVRGVWDVHAMGAAGLDVVRRPTGGRALLHTHDVTYSVSLPLGAGVPWRNVYDAINALLIKALQSLGAPARLSNRRTVVSPDGALCFTDPAEGEIMLGDSKIAGSAVWRADGGYLQHGSILLRNEQSSLERFRAAGKPDAATLTLPHVVRTDAPDDGVHAELSLIAAAGAWSNAASVAQAIRDTWSEQACDIDTFEPSPEDVAAYTIAHQQLAAPDWLWRR